MARRLPEVEGTPARGRSSLIITSLVVACVGVGAALGAGLHPASSVVRAQSELTVSTPTAGLQPIAWHTVGQVLRLPALRAQIAQLGGEEASSLRVGTLGDPRSSLITIYADASSGAQAQLLANSAASVAVNFLRQTVQAEPVIRSTFEQSSEAWDLGAGIYVLRPNEIRQTHGAAHGGAGSLEVACVTVVTGGCGPYLRLERRLTKGSAYLATGWVKAQPGTRIRLVLGSTPQDVAVGPIASGGAGWKQLSVTWVPQGESNLAVMAFQVMSLGRSRFAIDDVVVGPQPQVQHATRPPANVTHYETILPATSATTLDTAHTGAWAAGGAAAGLLAGVAAAAAATAARRRPRKRAAGQETLF
jgi:hypothetical protein